MSNLIPPLLSSSPPPIVGPLEEDEEDEFGDFRAAADSYDCDDFSLPPSPQKSPEKELKTEISKVNLDINSNKSQKNPNATEMPTQNLNGSVLSEVEKDFQDRRKSFDVVDQIEVNSSDSQSLTPSNTNSLDNQNNRVVEQTVDSKLDQQNSEEQISQSENENFDILDDDVSAVPSSIKNYTSDEKVDVNEVDVATFSNEDNLFEDSESVQEKTNNSEDLSELNETNEIKSEDEFSCEITDKDVEIESSKPIDYDNLSETSLSLKVCETDSKLSDDFGDFENHFNNEKLPTDNEDEFDDFVDPPQVDKDEDDFGDFESSDFGDFSSQTYEKPVFMDVDFKNAFAKSEMIFKEIFPIIEQEIRDFESFNGTDGNIIFEELKDVTETNALIYQWSKSNSQKMFLRSLNIDTRNILYGPAWNCSMPRFAANLGLTPLEPVKSEILTPTPVQNVSSPSNSSQKNNSDIPTAQFDWNGSGLINPLDYLEQLVASLDIPSTTNPNCNHSPTPSNELLDEWDLWLQSASTEPPRNVPEDSSQSQPQNDLPAATDKQDSIPSLFETNIIEKASTEQTSPTEELPKNQLGDFSPKLIPLRETHISTELNELYNKPGWLQPTIVTPDLPRKETIVDPEDDDEFDDFQMVLPEETKVEENNTVNSIALPDLSVFDLTSKLPCVNKPNNQEHIFGIFPTSGPSDSPAPEQTNYVNVKDDDEFTEFHSSLPPTEILKPLQPVPVEPLKPTVQYSQTSTLINWPEPGVTEEDIKNIELVYSRKPEPQPSKKEPELVVNPKPSKQTIKENSLDDDEWTDFVSVTNSVKPVLPERTSTPDLPLSVLNLNNVQAPKQPIPVITPSGLVQTKLSSNITLQPKSVVQTSVQPNLYKPPTTMFHPSIISNQFAANFFSTNTQPIKNQTQDDDDDWTDFVSGQPPPQMNGHQPKTTFNQAKNPQSNRTNIIMNPTHFESFQSYAPPQNKKVSSLPTRNAISSISALPDLDFIAPKNRTSKK